VLHHFVKQTILPQFAFPLVVLGASDSTITYQSDDLALIAFDNTYVMVEA